MLRKTLKYDLQSVYRLWIILTATVLVISVFGGLSFRDIVMIPEEQHFDAFSIFSMMGAVLTVFAIAAYILIMQLLVLYRYYQNFFTDEAYLTFTLPVKRSTLFNSKLLNALIWTAANILVVTLCVVIILALTPLKSDGTGCLLVHTVETLAKTISSILNEFNFWGYVYLFLLTLAFLLYSAFSTLLTYACITLGCTMVKKYKLLAAIATYYIANSVLSVFSYFASLAFSLATVAGIDLVLGYSGERITVFVLFLLLGAVAFFATICILAYKFSLSRIEKNLNLA